ncbi:MAG TPA: magnesium/cobalt transporter CorA [Prolixibacteraceae bacterium]|nr:magnesium/cobalt transporter CorA [Prolixibacteraceae bacterium]
MARFLIDRKKSSGEVPGSLIHLGEKKIDQPRLRLIHFTQEELVETEPAALDDCLRYIKENSVSWINIDGLHDAELIKNLGKLFNIHDLLLEDMLDTGQRPKVRETDDLMVILVKMINYDEANKKLNSEQITLILDDTYLITLQERAGDHFDFIRERIRKGKGRVRRKNTDYLTYLLLDAIVDNYLIQIEHLGNSIEKNEPLIFATNPRKGLMEKMYKYKTDINFLRKNIRPVKEIALHLIENESGFIEEDNLKYFRDLSDLVAQASETVEIYQTMLNDQMVIYHANVDSKANETMRVLTIFSAFFIPLTFVAGVYGMNFDVFPELHFQYGYLYFWVLSIVIVMGLIIYFRRKRWF